MTSIRGPNLFQQDSSTRTIACDPAEVGRYALRLPFSQLLITPALSLPDPAAALPMLSDCDAFQPSAKIAYGGFCLNCVERHHPLYTNRLLCALVANADEVLFYYWNAYHKFIHESLVLFAVGYCIRQSQTQLSGEGPSLPLSRESDRCVHCRSMRTTSSAVEMRSTCVDPIALRVDGEHGFPHPSLSSSRPPGKRIAAIVFPPSAHTCLMPFTRRLCTRRLYRRPKTMRCHVGTSESLRVVRTAKTVHTCRQAPCRQGTSASATSGSVPHIETAFTRAAQSSSGCVAGGDRRDVRGFKVYLRVAEELDRASASLHFVRPTPACGSVGHAETATFSSVRVAVQTQTAHRRCCHKRISQEITKRDATPANGSRAQLSSFPRYRAPRCQHPA
ncbi:hypothetical protein B0H10DRAFT_1956514 [Mycena sp. CBHHK59/15]|nr:hypothetical protein B0H10DRAFT_1956514 [Mycena sp. CBHHK59/15]